ncbi:asparagine synthase (glutamine-hydrolyzing) [Aquimarina intermedia]|uniref:asparagine synthase (glutamine-hydrolyzing) n=1 Tax=Aquimarina intermedia TaxID=350814 RepID=A0A5S5C7J0_9FLAO|nr:asparagine synthase (glutamine-hydrolyzing) [Aquimarina intermedia]TYP74356.1 asparagine synthase (glutamine-hydrolysing) [Aquimarina intermedia]
MCGICGYIKNSRVNDSDHEIIENMNRKLIHRGPDAQKTLIMDNVVLGFTRLSIIGLNNGMQPLYNEDKSLILICNGEIFNYIELKRQLKLKGHVFSTETDIEVILHLYEDHGKDFLNLLNGQFAFALYDIKKKEMFCARDHMGVIPFYYTKVENTFIFGSEVKAILEHPSVKTSVDLIGLDQVLTFPGLISPRTMFENIHSLENGHYLVYNENGEIKTTEYWDLMYPEENGNNNYDHEQHYIETMESLFDTSLKYRLRADVPSGIYLSGGLDSSMIASKIHKNFPNTVKDAFSIDFTDSLHSESYYQKLVAQQSALDLHQKVFLFDDISDRLIQSVYHSECPIKETYNTASLSLSESVRNNKIKVILSGEGADEFFAGYVGYRFDKMRKQGLISIEGEEEETNLREKLWGDASFFYERNYTAYNKVKMGLYSSAIKDVFNDINCLNHPLIKKERIENRHVIHKRAYIDYKIRLVDHLVSDHGDRMGMANSVEVRYPFLDKDIIEYSTTIPPDLKLNGFTEKYILKKIGETCVPRKILEREKFHFIAPGSPYLLQQKIEYIQDLLSYDLIKKQGYFDPDTIESLKKKYSEKGFTINAPYENDLLITVITFGIFLDQFFGKN